jgi:hypothetical protein
MGGLQQRAEGAAGLHANNTGGNTDAIAIYSEGDIYATGAFRGNLGSGGGAPFPRPAYDSGWKTINTCQSVSVIQFSGSEYVVARAVVDLQTSRDGQVFSNEGVGGFGEDNDSPSHGIHYRFEADKTLRVTRHCDDARFPYYRVRVWFYR